MEGFTNTQLDVADLPKLEELNYSPLDPKYLTEILIFRVILGVILLAVLFFGNTEREEIGNVIYYILAGGVVLAGLFIATGYFGFFKKGFALREKEFFEEGLAAECGPSCEVADSTTHYLCERALASRSPDRFDLRLSEPTTTRFLRIVRYLTNAED